MTVETIGAADLPRLFGFVEAKFRDFAREFGRYGASVDPGLDVSVGTGLLCAYDLAAGRIEIAFPDPADPVGRIHFLFMREMLGFTDSDEFARFIFLLMPRLLAHEMGHHLRHRHGRFGDDPWMEEQVANQFANAVTKTRYTPAERHRLQAWLAQAIGSLSRHVPPTDSALGSYYSPLHALDVMGSLQPGVAESVQVLGTLFAIDPGEILGRMESILREDRSLLDRRGDLIADFNRRYTSDIVRYLHYQLGWTLVDLQSREHHYLDDLVRRHLRRDETSLPPPTNAEPSEAGLAALYGCHRAVAARSPAVGRYFFKRYRSTLVALLLREGAWRGEADPLRRREVRLVVESWNEKDCDVLECVQQLVPPEARRLFPAALDRRLGSAGDGAAADLAHTDRRILDQVMHDVPDAAARRTVECLRMLDGLEGFGSLPAEILVELAGSLCRLECPAGETVIWEGSSNADVFILISGRLHVLMAGGGAERPVASIGPGEVFGEVAFLTGEGRSATVRASEDSVCFVLRAADLRIFMVKEPMILVQMARTLARRLRALDQAVLR